MILNCFFWLLESELIIVSERKYESFFLIVSGVFSTLSSLPFQGSESSDLFVELSRDDCEGICNPITLLMELLD